MTQLPRDRSAALGPNKHKLTTAYLDNLLRTRLHRQYVVWDTKETGLHVLVSPGSKHKKQATVTLRICYYLPDRPGVPKYLKLGRYPDDTVAHVVTVNGKEQEFR